MKKLLLGLILGLSVSVNAASPIAGIFGKCERSVKHENKDVKPIEVFLTAEAYSVLVLEEGMIYEGSWKKEAQNSSSTIIEFETRKDKLELILPVVSGSGVLFIDSREIKMICVKY